MSTPKDNPVRTQEIEVTKRNFELELETLKNDLQTKTIETEKWERTNQNLMYELKDVSDELYNTKIELTNHTKDIKDSLEENQKLKK